MQHVMKAIGMLREPLEQLLSACHPDCLVADTFFPWATNSSAKFNIPRLVFNSTSFFSMCAGKCISLYEPHKKVSSDSKPFVIPNPPDEIKMTRMQLPDLPTSDNFYELEPAYADYYRKLLERKAWHIGRASLYNRDNAEEKEQRGNEISIDQNGCLKWLDSKKPGLIVYVCFGTLTNLSNSQLMEIALGLEASGQQFTWVVRKSKNKEEEKEEFLPEEFEKRMECRGLITRGWAPQLLILDHEAVGGFVTHCGWNSTIESVVAGVSMVTWPVSSEQFYNEKLLTDVLKIGVSVGVQKCVGLERDTIKKEAIDCCEQDNSRG
ncbi:Glycosyltransferase [Quillaja saponaria]|uniref:Glycosyltransferase n=1 Tax=Quillaja saponaria TaxID=32244 RepID=A0AAD7M094_QUISA|nr:Glycosyltransferase [Quillaja saponaria]